MRYILLDIGHEAIMMAAIAVVMTLSARYFNLLNLAGGLWLALGGWLAGYVTAVVQGGFLPVNGWAFILFLPLALAQIATPLLLRRTIIRWPFGYLLVALGVSLAGQGIMESTLLRMSSAQVPSSTIWTRSAAVACLIVGGTVALIGRMSWYARTAFRVHVEGKGARVWWLVSAVVGLEIVLLMLLGAGTVGVHRGMIGSEVTTVVPILAITTAGFRPTQSALVAGAAVLAMRVLEQHVANLGVLAVPVTIAVLGVVALWRGWPRAAVATLGPTAHMPAPARALTELPALPRPTSSPTSTLTSLVMQVVRQWRLEQRSFDVSLVAAAGLFGVTALCLVASRAFEYNALRSLYAATLVTIAWIMQRHLGVRAVTWPMLAAAGPLLWAMHLPAIWVVLIAFAIVIGWSLYSFALRVLAAERALVVDLAAAVAFLEMSRATGAVLGTDSVRVLSAHRTSVQQAALEMSVLGAVALAATYVSNQRRTLRARVLALVSPQVGAQHGHYIRVLFCVVGGLLALLATGVAAAYHAATPSVTEADLSLVFGLMVLLFAGLMESSPLVVVIALVLVIGAVGTLFAGFGAHMGTAVGIGLMLTAIAPGLREA